MLAGTVEVLQAHGAVNGNDPVAGLVSLIKEIAGAGVERQDGARDVPQRLASGSHAGRGGGKQRREAAHERGEVFGVIYGESWAVARGGMPDDLLVVVLVGGDGCLYQTVDRRASDGLVRHGGVLFAAEGVDEDGEMSVELLWLPSELIYRANRVDELGGAGRAGGVQEGFGLGRGDLTLRALQFHQAAS